MNRVKKYNTETFIKKAREVHGNKYDYSKVEYVNIKTKVCIICPEHGEFWQTPYQHLNGSGCSKCGYIIRGNKNKSNINEFIKKTKEVHGDKYDYSKVEYVNDRTKVCIICPVHGEFWQTPNCHLNGSGCPKCAGYNKSFFEFKEEIIKKYGDIYDFSNAENEFKNYTTKITVGYNEKFFKITPSKLLYGNNDIPIKMERVYNVKDFINKAKEVHGDKYNYSKVEYINSHTKVCIICPEHGEFWQKPYAHLSGQGCPKCANNQKIDKEEFIRRAREIHGDKYDYSKVNYTNNYTKVIITCPEHGDFEQFPHSHLQGNGCQKCYEEPLLEKEVLELLEKNCILYVQQKKFDGLVYKRKLSFDFYLPEQNIAIECQGIQHFKPVEQFGGTEGFKEQTARDEVKRKFCDENGIKLLYYNHLSKVQSDYPVIHTKKKLLTEISDKDL